MSVGAGRRGASQDRCDNVEPQDEPRPFCLPRSRVVPDVPGRLLTGRYKLVDSSTWDRPESIPVLEMSALAWTVKHICRKVGNHGRKHLILSDSISAVCALAKG
eukprot:6357873-Heterocapsa_arctica.AAC.1